MTSFKDLFCSNHGVSLHYLDTSDYKKDLTPLVYVPGALGFADQFKGVMEELTARRCISLSLRGRGKSDAPPQGYTLSLHASDIKSFVEHSAVNDYCLMAYSMGVPYAIKYAVDHPEKIKGMILCEYQARYPLIPETWTEDVLAKGYISEDQHNAVRGIQQESEETYLWEELKHITCPVLVIKGGTEKAFLKNDAIEMYKQHLRHLKVIEFSDSGHELWVPDYNRFIQVIKQFLEELDCRS